MCTKSKKNKRGTDSNMLIKRINRSDNEMALWEDLYSNFIINIDTFEEFY